MSEMVKMYTKEAFNSRLGQLVREKTPEWVEKFIEKNNHLEVSDKNKETLALYKIEGYEQEQAEDGAGQIFLETAPEDYHIANLYLHKFRECQRRGLEWELGLQDLKRLYRRKTCQYSGTKLIKGDSEYKPTLERVDSKVGYTKENTIIVSYKSNQIKNILLENDHSEFKTDLKSLGKMIDYLRNKTK